MTDDESRKAIIRYDLGPATYMCGDYWSDMQISVDGDYVLYTDHITAVEWATKRERERCVALANALGQLGGMLPGTKQAVDSVVHAIKSEAES